MQSNGASGDAAFAVVMLALLVALELLVGAAVVWQAPDSWLSIPLVGVAVGLIVVALIGETFRRRHTPRR